MRGTWADQWLRKDPTPLLTPTQLADAYFWHLNWWCGGGNDGGGGGGGCD